MFSDRCSFSLLDKDCREWFYANIVKEKERKSHKKRKMWRADERQAKRENIWSVAMWLNFGVLNGFIQHTASRHKHRGHTNQCLLPCSLKYVWLVCLVKLVCAAQITANYPLLINNTDLVCSMRSLQPVLWKMANKTQMLETSHPWGEKCFVTPENNLLDASHIELFIPTPLESRGFPLEWTNSREGAKTCRYFYEII